MKLKLDDQGHAVLENGHPVYIHDDGKEAPFDAAATAATVKRLSREAKENRQKREEAEDKLKAYEGIEDPVAAKKAIETVKNLDGKKMIDAGEVEKLKNDINQAWEPKLTAAEQRAKAAEEALYAEKIGGSFLRSEYIGSKLAVPADVIQAMFGNRFKLEDGKVVGYDVHGSPIRSRSNPGENAGFDEAVEILIDQYPRKESLLKADNKSGGGTPGANGGRPNNGGKKQVTRAEFELFDAKKRMDFSKDGGVVVD